MSEPSANLNQPVTAPWWLILAIMAEGVLLFAQLWAIMPWFSTTVGILGAGTAIALRIKYSPAMKAQLASKPWQIRIRTYPAWILALMRCILIPAAFILGFSFLFPAL